jgi:hypothetical protein
VVTPVAGRGAEGDRREPRPDDLDAIGVLIHIPVKPHGSVTGPRMMGTPAAASRRARRDIAYLIQIITDCPAGPGL